MKENASKNLMDNPAKPTLVIPTDPFLTMDAGTEYCSILSGHSDQLPFYLKQFQEFTEKVIDIPESTMKEIEQMHIEREAQFKEAERKEEEMLKQQREIEERLSRKDDIRLTLLMNSNKYFVKRSCPVKIRYASTLNKKEHEFYLKAFLKFRQQPPKTSVEQIEYNDFISMQNRVFDEQTNLMNFSYQIAQNLLDDYNKTSNVVDGYINKCYSLKRKRVFTYPLLYRSEFDIPLKPPIPEGKLSNFEFRHIGHLLSLGTIPSLVVPSFNKGLIKFDQNDESLKLRTPVSGHVSCNNQFLYKCPVSEDPNANFLAERHGAHVVMSASAFKVIADNQEQPFDKEWFVPILIKSCKRKDENGKEIESRIIFLDKPLPKRVWLPLQKKNAFFKSASLSRLTRIKTAFPFRMVGPIYHSFDDVRMCNKKESDLEDMPSWLDPVSSEECDLESFGSESADKMPLNTSTGNKRKLSEIGSDVENDLRLTDDDDDASVNKSPVSFLAGQAKQKHVERSEAPPPAEHKVKQNVSCESLGLLDQILDKQDDFLKAKYNPNQSVDSSTAASNVSNPPEDDQFKNAWPWSNTIGTDWDDFEVKICPKSGGVNVHYQLFSFESSDEGPVKEERKEPIRIIIRHNMHGMTTYYKKAKLSESKGYVFFSKVENQAFFGCEVNSLSEISQQWASLVVRPNARLLHLRFCSASGSIMAVEKRNLEAVLKEGSQSHVNFKPQSVFGTFDVLFDSLRRVASGQYLLHHSPKTEAFVKLFKATDSFHNVSLNLETHFQQDSFVSRKYTTSPWLAIDTHVLTPFHLHHRKIPGTFPMELTKEQKQIRKDIKRKRKPKTQNYGNSEIEQMDKNNTKDQITKQ